MKLRSVTFVTSVRIGVNQHQGIYSDLAEYRGWVIEDESDPRGIEVTTDKGTTVIVPYTNCACLVKFPEEAAVKVVTKAKRVEATV